MASSLKKINQRIGSKTYQVLAGFDNQILDLIQIVCKNTLDDIASGKKVNYFEKRAQEALDTIFSIKQERLFGFF